MRHSPAGKNVSTEAEDVVRIRYQKTANENKLRRLSMCCSETSAGISERAIITCSYDL
jgi:hypothetical protein